LVLAGNNDADVVVARLTAAGALDTAFGTGGKTTVDVAGIDSGTGAAAAGAGRIVVSVSDGGTTGALLRLTTTIANHTVLAVGGSLNGTASVFAPDAA